MSIMGDIYTVHACELMDETELQGMQLLMVGAAVGPLTAKEVSAVFASPVLRAWAVSYIASYGLYCIREYGDKRAPVPLLEYLGALRQELGALIASGSRPEPIAAPRRRVRQTKRVTKPVPSEPARFLSLTEVAERIGVKPDTLGRYTLPEPDALIGRTRGWRPETIDKWNAARPGSGNWAKKSE